MKKLLALALAVVLALSVFAGCAAGGKKAELALITDIGTIDDKSFNQGAWEEMCIRDRSSTAAPGRTSFWMS